MPLDAGTDAEYGATRTEIEDEGPNPSCRRRDRLTTAPLDGMLAQPHCGEAIWRGSPVGGPSADRAGCSLFDRIA